MSTEEDEPHSSNFKTIVERIQKHKEGYELVTDIVFFIGTTGAGKTTTLLYLTENEIVEEEVTTIHEGIEVPETRLVCKNPVHGFVIGHSSTSETVSANAYHCQKSGLTLVDFAGQLDTKGLDIEIANTVGLYNTVSRASTVRIVLVIDFPSLLAAKGKILKQSLEFVSGFIPNLGDNFDSLTFLFTKDATVKKLLPEITKLKTYPEFADFTVRLLQYIGKHKEHLLVDPLNTDMRGEIVKVIQDSKPLETKEFEFRFPLSPTCSELLLAKLKETLAVAQEHLRAFNWAAAATQIAYLQLLSNEIHMMAGIKQIYDTAINSTINTIQTLVSRINEKIDSRDFQAVSIDVALLEGSFGLSDISARLNPQSSFDVIRESINRLVAEATTKDAQTTYTVAKRNLDLVSSLRSHLSPLLDASNKTLADGLGPLLRIKLDSQYAKTLSQIKAFDTSGNHFVEEYANYITKLMGDNLDALYEAEVVFATCTKYSDVIRQFDEVLEAHNKRFLAWLPKDPTTPGLSLSFSVLRNAAKAELKAHVSAESKSLIESANTALTLLYVIAHLQLLTEGRLAGLYKSLGVHVINCDFVATIHSFKRMHDFEILSEEVCSQVRGQLAQYRAQIQAQISNIISEVKKKQAEEPDPHNTISGCTFIGEKARVLQKAQPLELEFPDDRALISTFLEDLKSSFMSTAQRILNELYERLSKSNFEPTQLGNDMCALLATGLIPDALPRLQEWGSKFLKRIKKIVEQQRQLLPTAAYAHLAREFLVQEQVLCYAKSFSYSGLEVVSTVVHLADGLKQDIIAKITDDWKKYHTIFQEELKSAATTPNTELNNKLVEHINHLKGIAGTDLDKYLSDFRPSSEYARIITTLQSSLRTLEAETRSSIASRKLDDAEQRLEQVDVYCTVLRAVTTVEGIPHANLSGLILAKRLEFSAVVTEKLQERNFQEASEALQGMKAAASSEQVREAYKKSCALIKAYFCELLSKVQITTVDSVESSIAVLQIFDKGAILDDVENSFGIAADRANIYAKIEDCMLKAVPEIERLLCGYAFDKVYDRISTLQRLALFPELRDCRVNFKDCLEKNAEGLPDAIRGILNAKSGLFKIDLVIRHLEVIRDNYGVQCDSDTIREITKSHALQTATDITDFLYSTKIEHASNTWNHLAELAELACMIEFKATGKVQKLKADIASSRKAHWWNLLLRTPKTLDRSLAQLQKTSHSEYTEMLGIVESLCEELGSHVGSALEATSPHVFSANLPLLARDIKCYHAIAKAFASHETPLPKKLTVTHKSFVAKLQAICTCFAQSLDMDVKAKQWPSVEATLKMTEIIKTELRDYISTEFEQATLEQYERVKKIAMAVSSSATYLKAVTLSLPLDIDTVLTHLTSLQENVSSCYQILEFKFDSYFDIVVLLLKEAENMEEKAINLLAKRKYNELVTIMENLQKAEVFIKHSALQRGFATRFGNIAKKVADKIIAIETEVEGAIKAGSYDQVELAQQNYTSIFKSLSTFREVFPVKQNQVVKLINNEISHQVLVFTKAAIPNIQATSQLLLRLKAISSTISSGDVGKHAHDEMHKLLSLLLSKKFDFFKLAEELSKNSHGKNIIESDNFPQFKAIIFKLMNGAIAQMSPTQAMKLLAEKNKWGDTMQLQGAYNEFARCFDGKLRQYLLSSNEDLATLIKVTCSKVSPRDWTATRAVLPDIIASIFTVWSVTASKEFYKHNKDITTVLQPHPIQVLSIMSALGMHAPTESFLQRLLGYSNKNGPAGHLVQMGTGEGKSVVLAVLAIILALFGFKVSCACYSSYLSNRDFTHFFGLFNLFGVGGHIKYSTLAQLAESFINEQGDLRDLTTQFIEGIVYFPNYSLTKVRVNTFQSTKKPSNRRRVLLIDEVDVFTSVDFYGATYNPSTILRNANITHLLEYIWENQDCNLSAVESLPSYESLVRKYSNIKLVIKGAVQRMIAEVKLFNDPPYHVVKNKFNESVIGYNENGAISTSIQHGYRTCFAYIKERNSNHISKEIAQRFLGLTINCGQFSYAEIPKQYFCIFGVTGTLETLCDFEKRVVHDTYNITEQTLTPSIYGQSKLKFLPMENVLALTDAEHYHMRLLDNINVNLRKNKPVLVFFASELHLDEFVASFQGQTLWEPNIIKDHTDDVEFHFRKATQLNPQTVAAEVTLLTRSFGRGIDFACRDQSIDDSGGVHVIQAFLSEVIHLIYNNLYSANVI